MLGSGVISTNKRRAVTLRLALGMTLGMGLAGCDRGDDAKEGEDAEKAEADESPAEDAKTEANADATPEAPAADVTEGKVVFKVDGEAKSFEFLPKEKNMAMSAGTLVQARPAADATEEFSFNAMNFNVKTAELPAEIELGLGKAMRKGDDPAAFAKQPKVTVQYVSPEGVKYRGFATTTFESFDGGVAKGKMEDLELGTVKPGDRGNSPVKIEDLVFEVKI